MNVKWIATLILLTGCAHGPAQDSNPFDVGSICSPTCWLDDETTDERLRGCLACLDRLERENRICGWNRTCPSSGDKP